MDMLSMALKSFGLSPEMIQQKMQEAAAQFKVVTDHFDARISETQKMVAGQTAFCETRFKELEDKINALYPVPERAKQISQIVGGQFND